MKKAYWIAKYKRINNLEALGKYAEKAKKIMGAWLEKKRNRLAKSPI